MSGSVKSRGQSVARLYLDEHLGDLSDAFTGDGHDVVTATDRPRASRTDAWHFKQAMADGRVVVTLNRSDFLYLHLLWTTLCTLNVTAGHHHGVLTAIQSRFWHKDEWLDAVRAKLIEQNALTGRMATWLRTSDDGQWRWEQWRAEQA